MKLGGCWCWKKNRCFRPLYFYNACPSKRELCEWIEIAILTFLPKQTSFIFFIKRKSKFRWEEKRKTHNCKKYRETKILFFEEKCFRAENVVKKSFLYLQGVGNTAKYYVDITTKKYLNSLIETDINWLTNFKCFQSQYQFQYHQPLDLLSIFLIFEQQRKSTSKKRSATDPI